MKIVYSYCDIILTVTPEIKQLLELNGIDKEKLFSCRWGTDISLFKPGNIQRNFRSEIGIDDTVFLVGWLGSMNPFKGIKEIILPLVDICSKEIANIHFVLAGYGILEDEVKSWVRENPELPITVLGRIPYVDAPSFTGSLDAYIVPTNPESKFAQSICPVKCFDGIAMGVDVLVTKTPATEFLRNHFDNIHLCDFSVKSFFSTLQLIAKERVAKQPAIEKRYVVSHQEVSRQVAEIITSYFVQNQ